MYLAESISALRVRAEHFGPPTTALRQCLALGALTHKVPLRPLDHLELLVRLHHLLIARRDHIFLIGLGGAALGLRTGHRASVDNVALRNANSKPALHAAHAVAVLAAATALQVVPIDRVRFEGGGGELARVHLRGGWWVTVTLGGGDTAWW